MDEKISRPAVDHEPLWNQEESIAYEAACDAIRAIMGIYSHLIGEEERKTAPDTTVVEALCARRSDLYAERLALHIKDHAKIAHARKEYGALYRAWRNGENVFSANSDHHSTNSQPQFK